MQDSSQECGVTWASGSLKGQVIYSVQYKCSQTDLYVSCQLKVQDISVMFQGHDTYHRTR